MSFPVEQLSVNAKLPRATYRFQFNENFRLVDALALVPYLHALGISHVYASPLFKARPHSTHGYDVCDFNQLNPEIGTEADLAALVDALHQNGMGLVLDIVPNHMGIGPDNPWWWDVLTHGHESKFAHHFDIDWETPDARTRGKVLIPVLGDRYDQVLERGELQLRRANDQVTLHYFDNQFPIATPVHDLEKLNTDPGALDELLQQQHYRLTFYGHGDSELNYRRFFSISSLVGLRVENETVFNDSHALLRQWIERGWLAGLRVDHPDGLRDPGEYLRRLRALAPNAWITVEKILEPEEKLPNTWPVSGTTGYDFLNRVNGLFVDSSAEKAFTEFYAEFTGEPTDCAALIHTKKRACLTGMFAAEINRLAGLLHQVIQHDWHSRDFTDAELHEALVEFAACFPVYRTYVQTGSLSADDVAKITQASAAAQKNQPAFVPLFRLFKRLLTHELCGEVEDEFVARFQQLTGAVMAKGVEDTTFYCFNRFVSLNEVGGDPANFGLSADRFHELNAAQQTDWPHAMLATATHDTKRGEDVRMRLDVLSEIPEQWSTTVCRWYAMNAHHRDELCDANTEYFLYQTLVGAWPLSLDRALAYLEKSVREAKQHTNWSPPNEAYEAALRKFITSVLNDSTFKEDLENFVGTITDAGYVNSLAQTLIKLTAPGVPDTYQGCELWDFSLVDPDNRRPVDFKLRQNLLAEIKQLPPEKVWARRADGSPKLWLIERVLNLRSQHPGLFSGSYEKLSADGANTDHVVGFVRDGRLATIVPRFSQKLKGDSTGTLIKLPPGEWRNIFTGEPFAHSVSIDELFQRFPVALLSKNENA